MTQEQLTVEIMEYHWKIAYAHQILDALWRIDDSLLLEKIATLNTRNGYPDIRKYAQLMIDLGHQGKYNIYFQVSSLQTTYSDLTGHPFYYCTAKNIEIKISRPDLDDVIEKTNNVCPSSMTYVLGSPYQEVPREIRPSIDWHSLYLRLELPTINLYDENGLTSLLNAVINDNTETVIDLLDGGANPNTREHLKHSTNQPKNYFGKSALFTAVENDNTHIVIALLDSGADPNLKNNNGETPLYRAVYYRHTKIVTALLKAGADPNTKLKDRKNIVYEAALSRDPDILTALLNAGMNVNFNDPAVQEALRVAAGRGKNYISNVKVLLKAGTDVNARNQHTGETPLHSAANTDTEMVKVLLEAGADVNARRNDGVTPLYLAIESWKGSQPQVAALLKKYGARKLPSSRIKKKGDGLVEFLDEEPTKAQYESATREGCSYILKTFTLRENYWQLHCE